MEKHSILSKITESVCQIMDIPKDVQINDDLRRMGLNSLKTIALVVKLEEEFSINFNDDELLFENFSSIKIIETRVLSKIISS